MDENAEKKLQVDLKVFGRGIKTIPKSGDMEDLFKFHRIDAQSIAEDIKKILNINWDLYTYKLIIILSHLI